MQLQFSITQHIRDAALMQSIQEFFGCGYIVNDGATKKQFRIRGFNDISNTLIPFLDQYPLHTQKALDLLVFRQVHGMMKNGLHLTPEGLEEIRALKSTINRARMIQYKK